MFQFFKRHHTPIWVLVLLATPILVYRTQVKRPTDHNPLDRMVLFVTTPIERALSNTVLWCSERFSTYVDLRHAKVENIQLRREHNRLLERVDEVAAMEKENARLRALLRIRDRNPKVELVPASVIAAGHSIMERMVRIDKGLMDGVSRGMPVLSERGLVGRVQRAAFRSADVTLIVDEKVSIDVTLVRTRTRARLYGRGGLVLDLVGLLRTDDVVVGDIVETSGLGGLVPRGILVGRVTAIRPSKEDATVKIDIEPAVVFDSLEDVLVVRGVDFDVPHEPMVTPELLLPDELSTTTGSIAADVGPR